MTTTRRAHTTEFIVDGRDYFTARLDDGGVRVGLVGSSAIDIPPGHACYGRVAEAATEAEAEYCFDELMGAFA